MIFFVFSAINFKFKCSLIEIYFGLFCKPRFLEDCFARDRFAWGRFFDARFFTPFFLAGFGFFGFTGVLNPFFSNVSKDSPLFSIFSQCERVSVTRVSFLCYTQYMVLKFHVPVVRGKQLFFNDSMSFWGWFWLVCSMGKMTKFGSNGGKRAELKKKRSQFRYLQKDCRMIYLERVFGRKT